MMNRPPGNEVLGGLVALAGAGLMAVGAGVFPSALSGANAPLWVIIAVGACFLLAGLATLGQRRLPEALASLLPCLIVVLFAAIAGWVAWGDGPRQFSFSLGAGGFGLGGEGVSVGRIVFGFGAVVMNLLALFVCGAWLKRRRWQGRLAAVAGAAAMAYGGLVLLPAEPRWPEVADDHERLARYALLVEDEGWLRNKGRGPIHWYFPPWRNIEEWTKVARARLASRRELPPGATALTVPRVAVPPRIDGVIGEDEWRGALRITLEPATLGSTVYLLADGVALYAAADVPSDTTTTGFDQFRLWFHIDLSPWLPYERAFLDSGGNVNVLRTVRFPWGQNAPRTRTDWHTHRRAIGATRVDGHRRYEMALDLEEAGIRSGVPLPVWIEVEGDPQHDAAGKFKARTSLGETGSIRSPLWLKIDG